MKEYYVGSEIGKLRKVLLHHPNLGLKNLTPSNCEELLFDDVLSVERAGRDHQNFSNLLSSQHIEVVLFLDLLKETLDITNAKEWLLEIQVSDYRLGPVFAPELRSWLTELPHYQLAQYLSGGLTYSEIPSYFSNMMIDIKVMTDFILEPMPNHLFTRDSSCWIYNGVSINPMAKIARQRETNNIRAIYQWHPSFSTGDFFTYLGNDNRHYENVTIEGGDILVLGHGVVLMGLSERTSPQGIEYLTQKLFKYKQVKQVIVIELPKHRACMHLDTVLTHIKLDTFSIYPKIIKENSRCWSLLSDKLGNIRSYRESNLWNTIKSALGIDNINLITTGGDIFTAEREQWNDANNVLTISPGVIISYSGNIYTNEKYDKAGIKVMMISGDELGRGRGGARCMSCPLLRDGL